MEQQLNLAIRIAVDNWNSTLARTSAVLKDVSDEEMMHEASPGRNTGIYLLGHLIAVHDRMLPLLGLGAQHYPELGDIFLDNPDKSGKAMPPVAELRAKWDEINGALATAFGTLQPSDWLGKHTSVSEEDFAKQPHRNRLNVLLSRTIHLAEHYGQLIFLKRKA
jgi:hypothetical protein